MEREMKGERIIGDVIKDIDEVDKRRIIRIDEMKKYVIDNVVNEVYKINKGEGEKVNEEERK